jgi:hypothetical protein
MSPKKVVLGAALVALAVAATAVSAAMASSGKQSSVTTIKAVEPPPLMKTNRYIQVNLRWDKDAYTVASGGTLHIVNNAPSEGPHTFTVVQKRDLPRTAKQAFNCRVCNKLAKAHGADPNSDAPPKYPFLENGVGQSTPPSVDLPGDSGVTGPGKKGEHIDLAVTAPSGTKLYFMCLIHPWMQGEVDVN